VQQVVSELLRFGWDRVSMPKASWSVWQRSCVDFWV